MVQDKAQPQPEKAAAASGGAAGYNFHKDVFKAWTPDNPDSEIPRFQLGDMYSSASSDRFLTDASYLNFQNAQSGITELNLPSAPEQLEEFMNQYRYTDNSYTCEATRVDDFIEEMMLQKRIEFWGEGVLMYDYKRLDLGISRSSSNFDDRFAFDTQGRSPQWNIVIPRSEIQSNAGVSEYQNNPDPSGFYANRQ